MFFDASLLSLTNLGGNTWQTKHALVWATLAADTKLDSRDRDPTRTLRRQGVVNSSNLPIREMQDTSSLSSLPESDGCPLFDVI